MKTRIMYCYARNDYSVQRRVWYIFWYTVTIVYSLEMALCISKDIKNGLYK